VSDDAWPPRGLPDLTLRGCREHNLQGLDLELPFGRWVAVSGPSGSGKTSLVFDTVVRESQRRFLGALSARARQHLGKLGRADVDRVRGLPVTVAVGAATITRNPRSTVGTLGGALPLLRLLFARTARDPGGEPLTLSRFSFNHPVGACAACDGLGVEDVVDPALLVADPGKTIREGALRPTLPNGYTVYSQVTVDVMDTICRAHGFDVDTPWERLSDAQREVIFFGSTALRVPFGKHPLESRMKWTGMTARPRDEGFYRGLVPVLRETLARNRNANVLRYVRTAPCGACGGARLGRPGREARLGERTLPELLARPVRDLVGALDALPPSAVWSALRPDLERRLVRMVRLGLGHLSLDRESSTLSGGEAQRLRVASQLAGGLSGLAVALDEPTLGLHPGSQEGLRAVLDELRRLGNTLLVVEHDPDMIRRADHLVALGPGAGPDGGRVLHDGPPPADPLGGPPAPKAAPRPGRGAIALRGATLHGLRDADLEVRLGAFTVVLGPSGAGKSSLVFQTLLPALRGEAGGPYAALEGVPPDLAVRALDAAPIGRTPRSTPATYTGLLDLLRKRFAALPAAKAAGLGASAFSHNTKAGRCPRCEGLGFERVGLHLLEDVERPCGACGGGRYAPEVLAVRLDGRTVADVLDLRASAARDAFADDPPVAALCGALDDLGLGYLRLGQSSTTLSRGEAQRVKLAALLGKPPRGPALVLLDEPDRGLHPCDVARLLGAIDGLCDAGHTVLAISHHRALWAAADARVALDAGVATPDPELDWAPLSSVGAARPPARPPAAIRLEGVRTHTLKDVTVEVPRRALTVVAGVSGSGKSSLAFATLAAEAARRFAETLPFQVRRQLRRQPRPALDAAHGLGPTLALRQRDAGRPGPRSTVATQTGLGPLLRLLFSRAGLADGAPCGLSAGHFSPERSEGACPDCAGRGHVLRSSPERLVTDPDRPLAGGALSGTKAGQLLGEASGQFMAALGAAIGADALATPWSELSAAQREVALYGAGERVFDVTWRYARGKRSGEHRFQGTWDGLCALAEREARKRAAHAQAAAWAAPLVERPCEACEGARLAPGARAVEVGARTLPELLDLPVDALRAALAALEVAAPRPDGRDADGPRPDPSGADDLRRAALDALRPDLVAGCDDLCALGLGHLTLARRVPTLSDGELQRVRLASVLRSGLTGVTLVLDEPGAGLHARDLATLLERLAALRAAGHTVVVVSHRPAVIRAADHLLELGPGAGPAGGELLAAGPPVEVLAGDTPTARALRQAPAPAPSPTSAGRIAIRGARAHTLADLELTLPAAGFVAVTGVSGSGKSSLVFDVLAASAEAGRPVACDAADGLDRFADVRSARGAGGADTPLDALGLLPALQKLFAARAGASGLRRAAFSFRSPKGRCPTCQGTGRERVALEVLADLRLPCPACAGARYRPEVLAVRWDGLTIAELLDEPVAALRPRLPAGRLGEGARALERVGLGHLALGRPAAELSGGERPRLTLAAAFAAARSPALVLLDEPARGLHEQDLAGLVAVLREATARGDLVVAAVHRLSLIRAADEVVDLGPGSGPAGGRLVAQGPPAALGEGATAAALRGKPSGPT